MDEAAYAKLEAQIRALKKPVPQLFTYYAIVALATTFLYPFVLTYLYFRYHTLHYCFDEDGVSMGYGIWFRREMHLTYARMQDIHLSQNILERWLGIGHVTVQTAGGGDGGDLDIVGIREFEAVRDFLYAHLRGVRAAQTSAPPSSPETQLLAEIRDELRAATEALTRGRRS
jgi:putative membrane protein